MPPQGFWTLTVGLVGTAIPLIVLYIAIKLTRPHGFACTRCDHDIALGSARCANCGAPALNTDQPL